MCVECMCAHNNVYVRCICMCICMYICVCMYVYMYAFMYVCVCAGIRVSFREEGFPPPPFSEYCPLECIVHVGVWVRMVCGQVNIACVCE